MSKIAATILVLCAVLASPVLGTWLYDGTDVWVSEPTSDEDPYGTWWYGWDGDGSVDAGAGYLEAEGWTSGYCGVQLTPYDGDPLSQFAYVASHVTARSSYHWEGSGSKAIDFTIDTTIYSPTGVYYEGWAIDDTHVSVVSSTAGANAEAGGGVSNGAYFYPVGSGLGWATTQTGSGADNDSDDVTVSDDYTDSWNPPPYLYNVGYEGDLEFTASTSDYAHVSFSEPGIIYFVVDATVEGSCVVVGDIEINDPNYRYLYMGAEASYYIDGATELNLYGNIQ